MRTEYLATSFFTCGEDSSQDWYKLSEAAVKFEDIPHDVQVSELFEGLTAHELQSEILYVKRELDKFKERIVKRHTVQQDERDLIEDLISYYEIDLDNCTMTNRDWVEVVASVMVKQESRNQLLREIKDYKDERK